MSDPSWNFPILRDHYQRHPASKEEESCWKRVTGSDSRVSINEYEERAIQLTKNAWLRVDALYQKTPYSEPVARHNFYDSANCFVAVEPKSNKIHTFFHVHIEQKCDVDDGILSKKRLLKYLIRKKSANKGRLVRPTARAKLENFETPVLRSYFRELSAPTRTRGTV